MIGLLILLAIGLGLAWLAGVGHVIFTLTHPPKRGYAWALARNLPSDPSEIASPLRFEAWRFTWRGVELPVWDIQGTDPAGPTIIMTHGWGESRVTSLTRIAAIAPLSRRIVIWDLPGHGDARGICALGTREVDALLTLINTIEDPTIILMGWSLGAGVSIAAAAHAKHRIFGVIAEAPYRIPRTPARNVMRLLNMPYRATLPPAMWTLGLRFMRSPTWHKRGDIPPFDRVHHAANLTCPLLILHGSEDEICPVDDGRAIADAAPQGRFVLVDRGTHQTLWEDVNTSDRCRNEVAKFIRECLGPHATLAETTAITSRSDARSS